MNDDPKSADDHALLARLNALKQSSINLDAKRPSLEPSTYNSAPVDAASARALHGDLISRFKTLTGQSAGSIAQKNPTDKAAFDLLGDEDGKTVEDLLAELGPDEPWNVPKDEEAEIKDLLQAANKALAENTPNVETNTVNEHDQASSQKELSAQDRRADSGAQPPQAEQPEPTEDELDQEADEYLTQLLEQIKREPNPATDGETSDAPERSQQGQESTVSALNAENPTFPTAPSKGLDPPSYADVTADDELASRLANLGLPSVPSVIKDTSAAVAPKQLPKGYTDEEIDSWCIICNEDASLRCIGCDGDLYCTNCWLDGHKGPDAGYEERKHKAVQYNKGGGMKKQAAKRLVGA